MKDLAQRFKDEKLPFTSMDELFIYLMKKVIELESRIEKLEGMK